MTATPPSSDAGQQSIGYLLAREIELQAQRIERSRTGLGVNGTLVAKLGSYVLEYLPEILAELRASAEREAELAALRVREKEAESVAGSAWGALHRIVERLPDEETERLSDEVYVLLPWALVDEVRSVLLDTVGGGSVLPKSAGNPPRG